MDKSLSYNMMVKRVEDTDLEEILGWFESRGIPMEPDYLSPTGFMVPGKAAGFVFSTDSNFVIFECFVGNPEITSEERQEALRQIVPVMIQEAKEMGYKDAYGFATSQTMIQIGLEQGFRHVEKCDTIVRSLI
jgi:hypothetical protein